jgi:hypothetical protein
MDRTETLQCLREEARAEWEDGRKMERSSALPRVVLNGEARERSSLQDPLGIWTELPPCAREGKAAPSSLEELHSQGSL